MLSLAQESGLQGLPRNFSSEFIAVRGVNYFVIDNLYNNSKTLETYK